MGLEKRKVKTLQLMDDRHWDLFAEFTRLEMASGGPDPHVAFVGELVKDCSLEEKLWRGGCYISAYNVASAEIIWRDWSWPDVLDYDMLPWFEKHWKGITTRTERKGVRIKENMVTYFETYGDWLEAYLNGEFKYLDDSNLSPVQRYEYLWEDINESVKYFGRYVAIKLIEYFKRYCEFDVQAPDIRPVGGWSPRITLSLLFPEAIDYILSNDTKQNLAIINALSQEAIAILKEDYDIKSMDMFVLEVVLCNYRQSYQGNKLYPGRTHDTELNYYMKLAEHWINYPDRSPLKFLEARKAIVPHEHLSELNGNWGVRSKDIGRLTRQGLVWSDLLYDYNATAAEGGKFLDDPVVRENGDERVERGLHLRTLALTNDKLPHIDAVKTPAALKTVIQPSSISLPKTNAKALEIAEGELYQRGVFIDWALEKKLAFLTKYNIDVVVNLWHKYDEELVPYLHMYEHHYFKDSKYELDTDWLLNYAITIADLICEQHTVLIHCYGGNNRSGLLSALVYRELYGCSGKEAMLRVQALKSKALHNENYQRFLISLPELHDDY